MDDRTTHSAHEHPRLLPPTKEENVVKGVVMVRLFSWALLLGATLSHTGRGVQCMVARPRAGSAACLHVSFSILLLSVFVWSPQPVMLQFIGIKEVMETACIPFLWRNNGNAPCHSLELATFLLVNRANVARVFHHVTNCMVQVSISVSSSPSRSRHLLQPQISHASFGQAGSRRVLCDGPSAPPPVVIGTVWHEDLIPLDVCSEAVQLEHAWFQCFSLDRAD